MDPNQLIQQILEDTVISELLGELQPAKKQQVEDRLTAIIAPTPVVAADATPTPLAADETSTSEQ